jgi:hypothetical protein
MENLIAARTAVHERIVMVKTGSEPVGHGKGKAGSGEVGHGAAGQALCTDSWKIPRTICR